MSPSTPLRMPRLPLRPRTALLSVTAECPVLSVLTLLAAVLPRTAAVVVSVAVVVAVVVSVDAAVAVVVPVVAVVVVALVAVAAAVVASTPLAAAAAVASRAPRSLSTKGIVGFGMEGFDRNLIVGVGLCGLSFQNKLAARARASGL